MDPIVHTRLTSAVLGTVRLVPNEFGERVPRLFDDRWGEIGDLNDSERGFIGQQPSGARVKLDRVAVAWDPEKETCDGSYTCRAAAHEETCLLTPGN